MRCAACFLACLLLTQASAKYSKLLLIYIFIPYFVAGTEDAHSPAKLVARVQYAGVSQVVLQAHTQLMICSIVQDTKGQEWHQLAQRVFQDFSGLGKALSASEKQDAEKAATAEPWVHMVILPYAVLLPAATFAHAFLGV